MGQPNFWDNPEKAQLTIVQMKPLNDVLKPFEDLAAAASEIETLAELSAEDDDLEAELERELVGFEKRLADFELRSMLSGPHDSAIQRLRFGAVQPTP